MIKNIQVLRGLAALMVVFHHLQDVLEAYMGLSSKLEFGTAGVDIFFVISGFVITYNMQNAPRTPTAFWRDRALRILPLYWLATGLTVTLFALGGTPGGVTSIPPHHLLQSLLLVPYQAGAGQPSPLLFVGWTLVYEAYFYLVFGLLLFLGSLKRVIAGLVVLFTVSVGLYFTLAHHNFYLHTYGNPVLFEFLAGVFIGATHQHLSALPHGRGRLIAIGLVAISILTICVYDFTPIKGPGAVHVAYFLLPAAFLVSGALLAEKKGMVFDNRFFILLGAASYTLYLFHPFLLQPVTKNVSRLLGQAGVPGLIATSLIAVTGAVAAGILLHLHVERPLQAFLKSHLRFRRAPERNGLTAPTGD